MAWWLFSFSSDTVGRSGAGTGAAESAQRQDRGHEGESRQREADTGGSRLDVLTELVDKQDLWTATTGSSRTPRAVFRAVASQVAAGRFSREDTRSCCRLLTVLGDAREVERRLVLKQSQIQHDNFNKLICF